MQKLFEKAPNIIKEAAKSRLGVFALIILTLAATGVLFFQNASEPVKLTAFAMIVVSLGMFVIALLKITTDKQSVDAEINDAKKAAETEKNTDLVITSLKGANRLQPLDGHTPITHDNDEPVFTEGFRASFNLSHNNRGRDTIVLHHLSLEVNYFPGTMPKYAYQIQSNALHPAGTARAHEFSVTLNGNEGQVVRKVVDPVRGVYIQSKSNNFFETDDGHLLEFRAGSEDNETLRINVKVLVPGFYKTRFIFNYTCGGQDRVKKTDSIFIYYED